MGYVVHRTADTANIPILDTTPIYAIVTVRAILLWDAGSISISDYEAALFARQQAHRIQ